MISVLLVLGVLLAIIYAITSNRGMIPLVIAFLVGTYSLYGGDFIDFLWMGEMEAGFITLLGFWGIMAAIVCAEKRYLFGVAIRYTLVFVVLTSFVNLCARGELAFIDAISLVCWILSVWFYRVILPRRNPGIPVLIGCAMLAAFVDLAAYVFLGTVMGFDPFSFDSAGVYRMNVVAILILIPLYHGPLFFLPRPTEIEPPQKKDLDELLSEWPKG